MKYGWLVGIYQSNRPYLNRPVFFPAFIYIPSFLYWKNYCAVLSYSTEKKLMSKFKIYQNGVLASPSTKSSLVAPLHPPSPALTFSESVATKKNIFGRVAGLAKYSFLPQGFPESVHPNFKGYAGWFFLQNIMANIVYGKMQVFCRFSVIRYLILVLCTQAMLLSMGMSSASALSSAAALQWVIKDALGQFGGIVTAGLLGKI